MVRKPLLIVFCVFAMLVLANGVRHGEDGGEGAAQVLDADVPLTAYKRFYRWEDSKRAMEDEDAMRAKRKQFYAWAGKRSAPSADSEETQMQKRKQFYAWAGK